jgi:hypothetical protein
MQRRQFISGLLVGLAAPAIVRYASLMPVRAMLPLSEAEIWVNGMNEMAMVLHPNQFDDLIRYAEGQIRKITGLNPQLLGVQHADHLANMRKTGLRKPPNARQETAMVQAMPRAVSAPMALRELHPTQECPA